MLAPVPARTNIAEGQRRSGQMWNFVPAAQACAAIRCDGMSRFNIRHCDGVLDAVSKSERECVQVSFIASEFPASHYKAILKKLVRELSREMHGASRPCNK